MLISVLAAAMVTFVQDKFRERVGGAWDTPLHTLMEEMLVFVVLAVLAGGLGVLCTLIWLVSRVRELTKTADDVSRLEKAVARLETQLRSANSLGSAQDVAASDATANSFSTAKVPPQRESFVVRPAPPPVAAVPTPESEAFPKAGFAPDSRLRSLNPTLSSVDMRREESVVFRGPFPANGPATAPPPLQPAFTAAPISPPARRPSLEERLGHNWLNKLGVVTLVIGIALFLGYQLRTLGPAGKSALGIGISLALLAGGVWLERKLQYRIFARAGIGGGWALLFFVTFALYHVDATKVLNSQAVDLVLMMLIAAGMVIHSLRYRSQVVTSLAFLLAFVTVGISHVTLFSLVAGALLAAGLVFVAAREAWFELGLAGMVGAYANHFLWLERVLPGGGRVGRPFPEFAASAGLLLFYWLIFRIFYVLRAPQTERQRTVSSLSAVLNSLGLMALLKYQSSHPEWAFRGLLVLGSAEMVLAFVGRRRWRGSFVVLSTIASVLLLAAIPFRFSGAPWTLAWVLEAEVLFVVGLRMRELVFRRLGLLGALLAALQAILLDATPIFNLRQIHGASSRHPLVAIALLTTAAVLWLNAELAPRQWANQFGGQLETAGTIVSSYLGAASLGLSLWVFFAGSWTAVLWLVAAVALGWVADRLRSAQLAMQADVLTIAAVVRLVIVNFGETTHTGGLSLRAVTISLSAALLYVGARRKTLAVAVTWDYIAPAYSWTACWLLLGLLWYELRPISVAIGWAAYGLVLFELGCTLRRTYLRQQGYFLAGASFVRMFFANLNTGGSSHLSSPRVYTVVPLIAAFVWVYERSSGAEPQQRVDRVAGLAAAWMGTISAAVLLYFEVRPELVLGAWTALAVVLLVLGFTLRRSLFTVQALAMLIAAGVRGAFYNLLAPTPLATSVWTSRTGSTLIACALMLLALPICFRLRRLEGQTATQTWHRWLLARPEQAFFFVPLLLGTALLTVALRTGMITVSWVSLGVAVFLFSLWVGERSFRLSGLGLLLLGVGKIIFVDIWHASPTDRYLTLMITGVALLLVSFLYSRYRETILKFL